MSVRRCVNGIARVIADRDDEFIELVRENHVCLRKICRVYADGAEAQRDLYQDILVELWHSFPSFEGDAQPSTWLYRVALNTALSHDRRRTTRNEATLDPDHPMWDDGVADLDEKSYREMADSSASVKTTWA